MTFSSDSKPRSVALTRLFARHPRQWCDFTYLYPVISRRSRGLSIGINVNVDQKCSFDCVYCSVDTASPPEATRVNLDRLEEELARMIALVQGGKIWSDPDFSQTPEKYRRLNDIAFSGDGEPTLYPRLDQAMALVAQAKAQEKLEDVRIVLVTNASGLDRPPTRRALELLDRAGGEVWAKLDAGTHDYYQAINRSPVPFKNILRNILVCGLARPIVIQTMFLRWRGTLVPRAEMQAYTQRLAELLLEGCRIDRVQLYTVARPPREAQARPIGNGQLDRLADLVRQRLPMLGVEVFYKNG